MNAVNARVPYARLITAGTLALAAAWGCSIEDRKVQELGESGDGGPGASGGGSGDEDGGSAGGKSSGAGGGKATGGRTGGGGSSTNGGRGSGGRSSSSGGTSTDGDGGLAPGVAEALAALALAQCQQLSTCAPGALHIAYADSSDCITRQVFALAWRATLPDTALTATNVNACAAAVQAETCAAFLGPTTPAACAKPGARANGEPCNSRDQCASRYCTGLDFACGVCAAAAAVGDPCDSNLECPDDTACVLGECVKPALAGGTCTTADDCLYPLNCVNGKCTAPPAAPGAACDAANGIDCDFLKEFYCDSTTNKCVKLTAANDCRGTNYCTKGATCDQNALSCIPGPGDGDPCDATTDTCQFPARCIAGTCTLPLYVPQCDPIP